MTAQIIPFPLMEQAMKTASNPAEMQQLMKQWSALQAELKQQKSLTPAHPHGMKADSWRNAPHQMTGQKTHGQNQGSDPLMGLLLMTMLTGGLFGGAAPMSPMAPAFDMNALTQLALLNIAENGNKEKNHEFQAEQPMDMLTRMAALNVSPMMNTQQPNNMMNIVLMMLILKMFGKNEESGEGRSGGTGSFLPSKPRCQSEIAQDVFGRNLAIVEFKRNSSAFSRKLDIFNRQVQDVTVRRVQARQYKM